MDKGLNIVSNLLNRVWRLILNPTGQLRILKYFSLSNSVFHLFLLFEANFLLVRHLFIHEFGVIFPVFAFNRRIGLIFLKTVLSIDFAVSINRNMHLTTLELLSFSWHLPRIILLFTIVWYKLFIRSIFSFPLDNNVFFCFPHEIP